MIYENELFQLIHYAPMTDQVLATPLIVFPPWINRFYILDLTPEKSFVRWCVDQGISLFMVSWKSADESLADVTLDDYVLRGQVDAIDTVRDLLDVEAVHAIGYCVAGTTLAATLAYLAAKGEAAKVRSRDLLHRAGRFQPRPATSNCSSATRRWGCSTRSTKDKGYLDGRYMAATFNLLRGRDLIWNYVVNNYLMGEEPAPFDLLHWNGDVTNLPAGWHRDYLETLYSRTSWSRRAGSALPGTPIDLSTIATPAYIQAGREDHIAPPESVWKMMRHFCRGRSASCWPDRAISPAWSTRPRRANINIGPMTATRRRASLDEFVDGRARDQGQLVARLARLAQGTRSERWSPATGARIPGKGKLQGDRGCARALRQVALNRLRISRRAASPQSRTPPGGTAGRTPARPSTARPRRPRHGSSPCPECAAKRCSPGSTLTGGEMQQPSGEKSIRSTG